MSDHRKYRKKMANKARIICLYWEDAGLKIGEVSLRCLSLLAEDKCSDDVWFTCHSAVSKLIDNWYKKAMICKRRYK